MLDEAFAKSTRIFEGTIDIRVKSLGLKTDDKFEPLQTKIKKLEKHTIPEFARRMEQCQEIKKCLCAPSCWTQPRRSNLSPIQDIVNLNNTLFIDVDELLTKEKLFDALKTEGTSFREGLFIMKWGAKLSMVSACIPRALIVNSEYRNGRIFLVHPSYL